jgi:hypothetical protein
MVTKLDKTLKREIELNGTPYVITLSPEGIKIVEKGKRKGQELTWQDLMSGKLPLARALKDSVTLMDDQREDG